MFWGNCVGRRIVACLLIFIGVILLLCFMPFWLWLALLGAVLIGIGCFLLLKRYC